MDDGYVEHGRAILPMILETFGHQAIIEGAEIGVSHGVLSRFMLRTIPTLRLWMIDRWDLPYTKPYNDPIASGGASGRAKAKANADNATAEFNDRRIIIQSDSVEAANRFEDVSLDFAFVDADHGYEGCLADIVAWWPKVKSGGVLLGDDFDCPIGKPWGWGVKQAVESFAASVGLPYETFSAYTWAIRKP